MADEIIIETVSAEVIEVGVPGPQGPAGAAGTGLETLTTKGDTLYRGASTGQRLPIGTTGQILRVSASGIPEWGAAPASGVSSVNGETGAVTLDAADVGAAATNHSHQPAAIYCDAVDVADTTLSSGEPNGIYFRDGSDNGKAVYKSAQGYSLFWDEGEEEWVLGNVPQTAKYYIGTGNTEYPWQATSWALGPQGSGDTPVVDQALLSNFQRNAAQDAVSTRIPKTGNASSTEVVLGSDTRLSNARTPTAHTHTVSDIANFPTIPSASTATPSALGTASAGSATDYARADHVHSAEVSDSAFRVTGSTDATKKVALEVDTNVPSGQTVTLTAPSSGGTIALAGAAPASHAASHAATGSDPLTPSDIGAAASNHTHILATDIATALAEDPDLCRQSLNLGDMATEPSSNFSTVSHTHGNLTNDGKLGTTAGLPVVTTTAGAVTTLALGTAGQVLTVNSGANGVEFAAASGGGVTTGSVDNAVLRANGAGGSTSQSSDLVIDDFTSSTQSNVAVRVEKSRFSITADAGTDVITATGSAGAFTANDPVVFPTLTGGAGLSTLTRYFVRDISGDTFKVSTSSGGAAVNITTNYTGGTVELQTALVLSGSHLGGIIAGPRPDGTALGGNARGTRSVVDLQQWRTAATQVASGQYAVIGGGYSNTASGDASVICGGDTNIASGAYSAIISGRNAIASGQDSVCVGSSCTASGVNSVAIGRDAGADRAYLLAFSSGQFFSNDGTNQATQFSMYGRTSTNTAVELLAAGTTRFTIPSGKLVGMIINVVGKKFQSATSAHFVRQYALVNSAGTTSQVYAPVTLGTDTANGTSISVSFSDANDSLILEATGITSEFWLWTATIYASEVYYA